MTTFKTLDPFYMQSRQVGLANWGVVDLEFLCGSSEIEREIGGINIFILINFIVIKRKFLTFKLQATTNWLDKKFKDV